MCFWKRKVPADQSPTRGVQPGLKEDSGRFAEIDRSLARDTAIGRRKRMLIAAILIVLAIVVVFHKKLTGATPEAMAEPCAVSQDVA